MSSHSFRHFDSNRLPDPHLTPRGRLFPHRSPRQSSANAACGRFRASPHRAALKGHNLHLPRSTTSRSPAYITSPSPRSWHTFITTTSRSAGARRHGTQHLRFRPSGALPLHPPAREPDIGQYRHAPSHVPCRSRSSGSRRLHAGHRLANTRSPARLIPAPFNRPGFDASYLFRHVNSGSLAFAFPNPT